MKARRKIGKVSAGVDAVRVLKGLGFVVTERESTSGARKWWLKDTVHQRRLSAWESAVRMLRFCGFKFWSIDKHEKEARNDDFEIMAYCDGNCRRSHTEVFLAEFRRSRSGVEYSEGIDC